MNESYNNGDFATVSFDEEHWCLYGDQWVNARLSNLHIDISDLKEISPEKYVAKVEFYNDVNLYTATRYQGLVYGSENGKQKYLDNAFFLNATYRQHCSYIYTDDNGKITFSNGIIYVKSSTTGNHTILQEKNIDLSPLQMLILEPYWSKYIK